MYIFFVLDAAVSPFDIFMVYLVHLGWVIALAAFLVISAIIGIVFFTKKKKDKENSK